MIEKHTQHSSVWRSLVSTLIKLSTYGIVWHALPIDQILVAHVILLCSWVDTFSQPNDADTPSAHRHPAACAVITRHNLGLDTHQVFSTKGENQVNFVSIQSRHTVGTGPLAHGHLIWPPGHLVWHSTDLDQPPKVKGFVLVLRNEVKNISKY